MKARLTLLTLCALLLPAIAAAQVRMPSPDQPDLTIDAATRKAVIDSLIDQVNRRYIFPDKAKQTTKAIEQRAKKKEYDRITSAKEFADSLTSHLQAVTHDLHLRVHYRHEPLPERIAEPSAEEIHRAMEQERRRNYGFEKVQRLSGNVGYVDLRMFSDADAAQPVAQAAMQFLGGTDALIIDLRRNGGGSPKMIATLLTYLIEPDGERLNFNNFEQRTPEGMEREQWWTVSFVPGTRFHGKPIYVLVSPLTASAAEEFAYDVKTHKLGTVLGAPTAGGAHPGGMFRLNPNFAAFIATGRAVNPVTNTNWEGVGVQPDVNAKPEEALRDAHVAALEKIIESTKDEERKGQLQQALTIARETPADPVDDFVRRRMRVAAR
jgi:retinol-binding protein 3